MNKIIWRFCVLSQERSRGKRIKCNDEISFCLEPENFECSLSGYKTSINVKKNFDFLWLFKRIW